jgi:hypothetical protein
MGGGEGGDGTHGEGTNKFIRALIALGKAGTTRPNRA